MKITKKKVGLGVIVIIVLGILWAVLKPAPVEAADVDFTFGAEKKIEGQRYSTGGAKESKRTVRKAKPQYERNDS